MEGKPLALLTKEEFLREISSNLPELISDPDFIVDYKLRILDLSSSDRREFIEQTLKTLAENRQPIGAFLVSRTGTRLPPTASNWLKDFGDYIGPEAGKAKKEEYLRSPDFRKLEIGARTLLNNLFEFYELLLNYQKNPDQLARAVVKDESGRIKIMDKGELVDFEAGEGEIKETAEKEEPEKTPESSPREEITPEAESEETKPAEEEKSASGRSPEGREEKSVSGRSPEGREETKPIEPVLPPSVPQKAVASSYLHPEDEEEIKSQQDNLSGFSLPELSGAEAVVKEIIEKNNLSFPDDILETRFKSIAASFLKGIRNKRETLALLTKSSDAGGLEYSENLAEKIIEELAENENMMYAQRVMAPEKPAFVPSPRPAPLEEDSAEEPLEPVEPAPKAEEYTPARGQQYDIPESIKYPAPSSSPRSSPPPQAEESFKMKRPFFSGKKRVEDIRGKAKIVGPIDELRNMSRDDFERLGTERITSPEKVYDKITLLKEESFAKYAEGIKAWRDSEVYRLYLEMGAESMARQKNISEIAEERKAGGKPFLTASQFNDIADLNKKLRF